NEGLVRCAKEQGYSAVNCEDVSGFDDDTFELVVAFDVIEHIREGELYGFLLEIKRILRDGGHFIARFPNGDSPFGLPYQNGDVTHVTAIGSGKVAFFAAKSNMEMVFLGGEAQPIGGTCLVHFVHRLIAVPTKRIINCFVKNIFFPRSNIEFCAANLTLIYKARKNNDGSPACRSGPIAAAASYERRRYGAQPHS
ncbi:Cyclopropane-fatty-acyl-phospholipid, partial [mine drainage metagenome]